MKTKRTPMRRCVGCMESKPKNELVRIACYEGRVSVDRSGKAKGRGVYLCPDGDCLKKAEKKRALQRNLSVSLTEEELASLMEELRNEAL